MATIILVRHGHNEWVKQKRLAGWLPGVHLNDEGWEQAAAVADRLAALPIKAIYSSPLTRCLETAEAIARPRELEVAQVEELGEVRYGQWEGEEIGKLAKEPLWRVVQFSPSRARFPDGESLFEVQARAVAALEKIAQRHGKEVVIVVSHADVIRLVLAHYLGIHLDLYQRLAIAPASISIVALGSEGHGARVLRLNDDGALDVEQFLEKEKDKEKEEENGSTH